MVKLMAHVEFDPVSLLLGNGSEIDLVEEVANRLYEDTGDRDALLEAFREKEDAEQLCSAFDRIRYTDELKPHIRVVKEEIVWDKEDTSMLDEVTFCIPYIFYDESLC